MAGDTRCYGEYCGRLTLNESCGVSIMFFILQYVVKPTLGFVGNLVLVAIFQGKLKTWSHGHFFKKI